MRCTVTLLITLLLAGCAGRHSTSASPPGLVGGKEPSMSAEEASAILGKAAKRASFPYLERRGITVFKTEFAYYAFGNGKHAHIVSTWGGSLGDSEMVDLNNDGRQDLIIHFLHGSGMVRPGTTAIIDDGKGLRVFRIRGRPYKSGQWRVPHPLASYGDWRNKAEALLHFGEATIRWTWPVGTREEAKWNSVVSETNWVPNVQKGTSPP